MVIAPFTPVGKEAPTGSSSLVAEGEIENLSWCSRWDQSIRKVHREQLLVAAIGWRGEVSGIDRPCKDLVKSDL